VLVAVLTLLPTDAAAGLLTAGSAGIAAVMIRSAVSGRSAGPRLRALTLAAGILLAALAGVASGIAALVAPHALVADVPLPAEIPLIALFLVAGIYLPAILRPHQRRDPLARLQVGLDILGVTACLIFPPWLLLFSGEVEPRGASITALTFGGGAAAAVGVAGVHSIRHRAALQWCGPAAALSLIGLTALVVAMDFPLESNAAIAAVVAAVAINVAAVLLWHGSVRIPPTCARSRPPAANHRPASRCSPCRSSGRRWSPSTT
jgi:hypothetical protein